MLRFLSVLFRLTLSTFFIGLLVSHYIDAEKHHKRPEMPSESFFPSFVDTIPNCNHCYRSAQLNEMQMDSLFRLGNVETVIRLNRNNDTEISEAMEKQIAEKYDIRFISFDPHKGYEEGRGYGWLLFTLTGKEF